MTAEPVPETIAEPASGAPQPGSKLTAPMLRPVYFLGGLVLVGVGIAGYILPVLPGTIWLILAAACFARSSPRLEAWLLNHPRFGPSVLAWRTNGAIPRKAKLLAIGMMAVSFAIVASLPTPTIWIGLTGVVLLASAIYVGTRPDGPKPGKT